MAQSLPRTGTRTLVTLLLIAALAAIVWKLYVDDDEVVTNTNVNTSTEETNNNVDSSNTTNTANVNTASSRTKTEQIEKNGFYSQDLPQPTVSADGQEAFLYNDTNAISSVDPETESIIRASYGITTEEEITIDGVKGKRLKGSSPKDGAVVEYILITNGDKLIFARGTNAFLDTLIATLELD